MWILVHVKATVETEKHIEEDPDRLDFGTVWKNLRLWWKKSCSPWRVHLLIYTKVVTRASTSTWIFSWSGTATVVFFYYHIYLMWTMMFSNSLTLPGCSTGGLVGSDIRCSVMISLCNAVYKYFLNLVSSMQQSLLDSTSKSTNSEHDSDSVYYRFCGAAIAEMLHGRYSKANKVWKLL